MSSKKICVECCSEKTTGKFCNECKELILEKDAIKWCNICKLAKDGKFCNDCGNKLVYKKGKNGNEEKDTKNKETKEKKPPDKEEQSINQDQKTSASNENKESLHDSGDIDIESEIKVRENNLAMDVDINTQEELNNSTTEESQVRENDSAMDVDINTQEELNNSTTEESQEDVFGENKESNGKIQDLVTSDNDASKTTKNPPHEKRKERVQEESRQRDQNTTVKKINFIQQADKRNAITIVFSAFIHSAWKGRVVIFAASPLGNWKKAVVEMKRVRSVKFDNEEIFDLIIGEACINRNSLKNKIGYKYAVLDEENNIIYEELYTTKSNSMMNRSLSVEASKRDYDNYHQIDDVVFPSQQQFESKDKSIPTEWKRYTAYAYKEYCNEYFKQLLNVEKPENNMNNLRALYTSFFEAESIKNSTSEVFEWKKLKDDSKEVLCSYIKTELKNVKSGYYSNSVDGLVAALQLIMVIEKLMDVFSTKEDLILLMECLSVEKIKLKISPNVGNSSPSLSEIFEERFSAITNKEIFRSLFTIWCKIVKNKEILKDGPAWCYPLVLIHELSKYTKEYKLLSELSLYDSDTFDSTFKNLHLLENSMKTDKILQEVLIHLMEHHHFVEAFKCKTFKKRLLVNSLIIRLNSNRLNMKDENTVQSITQAFRYFDEYVLNDSTIHFEERCDLIVALVDLLDLVLKCHRHYRTMDLLEMLLSLLMKLFSFLEKRKEEAKQQLSQLINKIKKKKDSLKTTVIDLCCEWNCGSNYREVMLYKVNALDTLWDLQIFCLDYNKSWRGTLMDLAWNAMHNLCLFHPEEFVDVSMDKEHRMFHLWEDVFERNIDYFLNVFGIEPEKLFPIHNCSKSRTTLQLQEENLLPEKRGGFDIIRKRLLEEWTEANNDYKKLIFILTWKPLKIILKNRDKKNIQKEELIFVFEKVKVIMNNLMQSVEDWSITIMEMLLKHQADFFELITIIEDNEKNVQKVTTHFEERSKEFQLYKELKDVMAYFVNFLKDIPEQTLNIRKLKIKLQANERELKLKDVFAGGNVFSSRKLMFGEMFGRKVFSVCHYFEIKKELFEYIKPYYDHDITRFKIFERIWNMEIKQHNSGNSYSIDAVITNAFIPAVQAVEKLLKSIADETILTKTIMEHYNSLFDSFNEMQRELNSLFIACSLSSIHKLMPKIECLVNIGNCVIRTESILKARKLLELDGDFSRLERIHNKVTVRDNSTLKEITIELMKDVNKLMLVDATMDKVFQAVSQNIAILKWLQQTLKGPNEVKVFVEMMSIAAGENDYEVDRVACFEATCTAFAPIIFELNKNSDFADFDEACRKTSYILRTDEQILAKLADSNRNIEWFKKARQSQGSVSTKSLLEAKQVNKSGTFTIGNLSSNISNVLDEKVSLNDVIKLEIPYENDKKKLKTLSLIDIHDLQSRLMLLVGVNEEDKDEKLFEIEFFVEQAELITNLGTSFVFLVEAGYTNVLTWKYEWKSNIIKAKQNGPVHFFEDLKVKTRKFEKTLKIWRETVTEFRKDYPVANTYTMKQCLLLRKYLFECCQLPGNELPRQNSDEVFLLLQCLSDKVTREKIKQCCSTMHSNFEVNTEEHSIQTPYENNFTRFSLNDIKDYCSRMENDFDVIEEIVLASLMVVDIRNEDEAIIWCRNMADDDDEDEIESLAGQAETEINRMERNLLEQDEEEETYETVDAFLSLPDFGKFLQEFADRQTIRNVPDYLNKGKPSLVLVPKDDILLSLLAMYDNDGKGSLPERDEVLLCSSNVSVEQIELLILRAVHSNGGLYCLAFADELDYKTTERVIAFLVKSFSSGKMNPFVIMCNIGSMHQSLLISALETYRINFYQARHNVDSVRRILTKSLCMSDKAKENGNVLYGASVDKEWSNTRCVTSKRGGMGKSRYVEKHGDKLENHIKLKSNADIRSKLGVHKLIITVPVHGTSVSIDQIVSHLLKHGISSKSIPRIYHFDVAPTVYEGLDELLFNVVILGSLQTTTGKVWRKEETDLCFIEYTTVAKSNDMGIVMRMIPKIECATPTETFNYNASANESRVEESKRHHDITEIESPIFQRVIQYINTYVTNKKQLDHFTFDEKTIISATEALRILLRYCGVKDPSWMEITSFVHFFNQQLIGCENSVYISELLRQDIPGFKSFVIAFLLEMARDFSTRSLVESEKDATGLVELKRTWEQSSHPYLFFNSDGSSMDSSMTFFGINVTKDLHLVDQDTQKTITQNVMRQELYTFLLRQLECDFVNLQTNYSNMERKYKIRILCRVLGVQESDYDPDPTYELTVDNMKKMLAIHMRSRCSVPVVLMGETGCGKTSLINFMSKLRAGPEDRGKKKRNMLLVKVHGGTTMADIQKRIREAQDIAEENKKNNILVTTLFLDEANTSDAIGLIKEIMVDKKIYGEPLGLAKSGLEVIAACNPYRQHSKEMIEKLESAGLGYHVGAIKTYEKIGEIPLRQLVYRVHPLPESMKPLVWDFGQLNVETEKVYTRQIIRQYERDAKLPQNTNFIELLVQVLAHSQQYMRCRKDECSFVSLRDVKRAVQVTSWFYRKMKIFMPLIKDFDGKKGIQTEDSINHNKQSIEKMRRSLILALSVCYIARLEERDDYIESISKMFTGEFSLRGGASQVREEIRRFQEMVMSELKLEDNIAKNQALCENVFMMVICIELRIPLFVVGKPGSSKSLAKTIVQDNMQGNMSKSEMFKKFKQVFMSSYQCSPLSTAEGIISVFRQSSRFQEGKNLEEYTSVVVLDEVGLAEDSPRMPLKVLHPLLEDGTDGSGDLAIGDSVSKDKRVAVIGISNWSLDPAKMNRGIMLRRCPPTREELINTARDICASDKKTQTLIAPLLEKLAEGYSELYTMQKSLDILKQHKKEEFFGLRDFYSLVKMIFCNARKEKQIPSTKIIKYAVKRNFSGMEGIDSWSFFEPKMSKYENSMESKSTTVEMIKQSFKKGCPCSSVTTSGKRCTSNRYLLVMTEKYSALPIIEEMCLEEKENMTVIFGSSFPKDQEFTQVCRDVNRIKLCMETGKAVVLLNMENLYESLYDALNQNYVYFGGKRYIDLGLGTHRVKCRVHEDFKLIVIADKDMVYERFPIPLINRLEKHYLVRATSMTEQECQAVSALNKWADDFSRVRNQHKFEREDAFIGFSKDACAAIINKVISKQMHGNRTQITINIDEVLQEGMRILLKIATPEAIARCPESTVHRYKQIYYEEQNHASLTDFMNGFLSEERNLEFIQVTTFSRLLTEEELKSIHSLGYHFHCLQLVQFETEHSFREAFTKLYKKVHGEKSIIAIQYSLDTSSTDLVPCAQHICKEIAMDINNDIGVRVIFILQLHRGLKGLINYQPSWECIHLDELRQSQCPTLVHAEGPISKLFKQGEEWKHVIFDSIQGAIEKVNKDLSMTAEEITRKLDILVELFQEEDFTDDLIKYVHENLRADEKNKEGLLHDKINNWVATEAKELKFIPGYGTFREALVQCVEEKVVPVLADLIIQMDANDNLLVLENQKYKAMWIQLFHSLSLVIDSSEENRKPIKFGFSSKFPFSYMIMLTVHDLGGVPTDNDDIQLKFECLLKAFFDSHIYNAIDGIGREELVDYCNDVILYHYKLVRENAVQIISKTVLRKMDKFLEDQGSENFQASIPAITCVINLFKETLDNVVSILNINPEIVDMIEVHSEEEDFVLFALLELLRYYLPEDENFEKIMTSKEIRTIVEKILTRTQFKNKKMLRNCRTLWMKLTTLRIYMEDVIYSSIPYQFNDEIFAKEVLTKLWNQIDNLEDPMESLQSWVCVENLIKNVMIAYDNEHADKKYDVFKKNLLQFFVDFVMEFCFSREKKEFDQFDRRVITKILGYAFSDSSKSTKQFSPLEDFAVDETPVFRLFIVQQLLKKNEMNVHEYLKGYLEKNFELIRHDYNDYWSICKIFVYCYEDHLTSEANLIKRNADDNPQYLKNISKALSSAGSYFKNTSTTKVDIDFLKNVAMMRMSISISLDLICKKILDDYKFDKQCENVFKEMLANLMKLIDHFRNSDIHMFTLRSIIAKYGNKRLHDLISKAEYTWLQLEEPSNKAKKNNVILYHYKLVRENVVQIPKQDIFLVYGKQYQDIREKISQFCLEGGKDDSQLKEASSNLRQQPYVREFALLHYTLFPEMDLEQLQEHIEGAIDAKNHAKYLQLRQQFQEDRSLIELICHIAVVFDYSQSGAVMLLKESVNNPSNIQGCYLPTMPSDNFEQIRAAGGVPHQCPNGHPYIITECGRAWTSRQCAVCHAVIGGSYLKLADNNKKITGSSLCRDNTKPGHCIGTVRQQPTEVYPERNLNPLSIILQRFLLHLSMLLGSLQGETHRDAIARIFDSPIQGNDIIKTLMEHIKHDFFLMRKLFGKQNNDDIYLLAHLFSKYLLEDQSQGNHNVNSLRSKQGRDNFENWFHRTIIAAFIQNYDNNLTECKKMQVEDTRIGENPVQRRLYELDLDDKIDIKALNPLKCFHMWSYRQPINIQHFKLVLQEKNLANEGKCQLSSFLEQDDLLCCLKNLPEFLEFQEILFRQYAFKIDKKTAKEKTLSDELNEVLKDKSKRIRQIVKKLSHSWRNLIYLLKNYGRIRIDEEFQLEKLDLKTPLAYFLASKTKEGACFMALIDFLAFNQNEFLSQYEKLPGSNVETVSMLNLRKKDVIDYEPKRDLLPLLLMNCEYSLEVGKTEKAEYNFERIQKCLLDRICFGKMKIDIQIKEFVYRDDIHNSRKFTNLGRVVHQESISLQDQRKIVNELKEIADLSYTLDAVEIAIGFLSSTVTSSDPEKPYVKYLEETLRIDTDKYLKGRHMKCTVRLKHLTSVWLALTVEKAVRYDSQGQQPFDEVIVEKCSDQLDNEQIRKSKIYLKHVEVIEVITCLIEFIVCGDLASLPDNAFSYGLMNAYQVYEDRHDKKKTRWPETLPSTLELRHLYSFWKVATAEYRTMIKE